MVSASRLGTQDTRSTSESRLALCLSVGSGSKEEIDSVVANTVASVRTVESRWQETVTGLPASSGTTHQRKKGGSGTLEIDAKRVGHSDDSASLLRGSVDRAVPGRPDTLGKLGSSRNLETEGVTTSRVGDHELTPRKTSLSASGQIVDTVVSVVTGGLKNKISSWFKNARVFFFIFFKKKSELSPGENTYIGDDVGSDTSGVGLEIGVRYTDEHVLNTGLESHKTTQSWVLVDKSQVGVESIQHGDFADGRVSDGELQVRAKIETAIAGSRKRVGTLS